MEGRAFLATRTEKGKGKEMPVNRGRVRLLVAALRSGEYKKGRGKLHQTGTEEGWCCLGVASDVAHKFGLPVVRAESDYGCESFDGEASYLPQSVMDWYGFDSSNPRLRVPGGETNASTVNDSGYVAVGDSGYTQQVSLDEIGRFFRDTYLKKH